MNKLGLAVGALAVGLIIVGPPKDKRPPAPPTPPTAADAAYACKYFTGKQLHDPGSAEFDNYHTYPTETLSATMYRVQVHVRAKNGFGALRKMVMECNVIFTGGNWQLLGLKQIGA